MFQTNYENVNEYGILPAGEYEAVIQKIEERTTPNGATGLNLTLIIRNDVEQKYQNRLIFHTLWKRREPTKTDLQVQGYSFQQIMTLAKSAALPSGKSYETVQDLCADLVQHPIRVTVGQETWNGKRRAIVKFLNTSRFPNCKHQFQDTEAKQETVNIGNLEDFEEILGEEDVPF